MPEQKLNGRLAFAIAASAIGSGFQHGYNTGVVNAPQKLIENFIEKVLSDRKDCDASSKDCVSQTTVTFIWACAVSIFCFGGMIGGGLTSIVANRLGRKSGLIYNNILVFIAAILMGVSKQLKSFEILILGRLIVGVNCGLNAGLAPMFLNEISPTKLRGAVGTVYQLVLVISILISQILGIKQVMGTADLWPLLLALTFIPAIPMVILMCFCPETPKFILHRTGNEEQMRKSLSWFRGTDDVQDEVDEIKKEHDQMKSSPSVTLKDLFQNKALKIPTTIAIVIMVAQQLSGINAAMYYSTQLFTSAGHLSSEQAQYGTLGMGSVNVIMTVISLVLIDKAGRTTLLKIGFGGMAIDTVFLILFLYLSKNYTWAGWASIIGVMFFVITFAVGPGSIPWFLVNEIFHQSARPVAASLAVFVNWAANTFVGLTFAPLENIIHQWTFIFFLVCQVLTVIFIHFYIPETKQKPIHEITAIFEARAGQTTAGQTTAGQTTAGQTTAGKTIAEE